MPPRPARKEGNPQLWIGTCTTTRKRQYDERDKAKTACKLSARRAREKLSAWSPYVCQYCNFWHIGHNHNVNKYRPRYADDERLADSIVCDHDDVLTHRRPVPLRGRSPVVLNIIH